VRLRHNVLDGFGRGRKETSVAVAGTDVGQACVGGDPVRGGNATSRTCVLRVIEPEERVLT